MRVRFKHLGLLFGLFLGWLIVQYDVFQAVFVLALAAVGWVVGRVLDGDTDLLDRIRQFRERDDDQHY